MDIPEGVTSIGEYAFYGCNSLTAINIAKSVTSIGKEALKNSGITYLTILGKPTIDKQAFEGCNKLTNIFCNSEENLLAEEAFDNLDLSRITLYVPESAIETYKNIKPRVGSVRVCRFFE